jgi:DNA-directed RNA polymerase subunit RPC12/RpoP
MQRQYDDFEASQLFCPKCRQAVPVSKRLLLVLPQGEKYDYICSHCSTPVGEKLDTNTQDTQIIVP